MKAFHNDLSVAMGVAGICLLSACQATPYVEPTSGPTATLTVMNVDKIRASFYAFESEQCDTGPHSGQIASLDGTPKLFEKREVMSKTTIQADRPFAFAVNATNPVMICQQVGGVFTPESGAEYELVFKLIRLGFPKLGCSVELRQVQHSGNAVEKHTMPFKPLPAQCNSPGS